MQNSSLLAPPSASAEQCARFLLSRAHGAYTEADIRTAIVPGYFSVCAGVGLDPVLLLAQMIHETGNLTSWWSQRPRRNPAGIGVTGRVSATRPTSGAWALRDGVWVEGVSFASWSVAIPAHVGRLLAYVLRDDQATAAQQKLIDQALAVRPLPFELRGVAPQLQGLNGHWAVPGYTYADKLARIARALQET